MSDDVQAAAHGEEGIAPRSKALGSLIFAAIGFAIFGYVLVETMSFSPEARPFPRFIATVGIIAAIVTLVQSYRQLLSARREAAREWPATGGARRHDLLISYLGPPVYGAMLLAFGFWAASAVFLTGLLLVLGERRPALVAGTTVGTLGAIYLVFEVGFGIRLPGSLLLEMLGA
jgi:hypothetical protein